MRKRKYLVLVLMLLAVLVVESSAKRSVLGPIVSDLCITLLALGVFLVVFQHGWERTVAFATAMAMLALTWGRHLPLAAAHPGALDIGYHALQAVFLGFAVAVILRNIFGARAVSGDEVLGTVCGYLLAAGMWAHLYALTALLVPGAFASSTGLSELTGEHGQTALFNYFSVVTLTTMGYGDVTPVRPPANALAMLEAIFGQFYIAIVVAQLVGLRLAQAIMPGAPRAR